MSDSEGAKKSGYRLEYATSNRAKCKGPKPCQGTTITKGELKFGSLVDFRGNTSFTWRHWGCVTEKIFENAKKSFDEADELDGFEELKEEDQNKVRTAWEEGHVAEEDIPESAKKPTGDDEESDGEEEKPKKRGSKASKKKEDAEPKKTVFKLEYASSGRSKCKDCGETVGKNFFRLGNEASFRGNTSFAWHHWGCTTDSMIASLKASYNAPSEIDGFVDLKEAEKEKVQHAWDEGAIPEDDKGVGEAVDTGKKKAAPRKKKEANGDEAERPKRSRAKKTAQEDDDDEEEEKPKKRVAAKPAAKKARAPAKKRASKKDESEDGEDFGDEIAAVEDDEEEEELEEEENPKKRKRAPASKGTSSKPPSKRAKPTSSRGKKKQQEEIPEESELEDD